MKVKQILIFLIIIFSNNIFGQQGVIIAKKSFPYTVSIVIYDNYKKPLSLGSGFIVSPGKVVTNLHVVEGGVYGEVIEDNEKSGDKHKITGYTSIDKKNDLVLLSVPSLAKSGLTLNDSIQEIGQNIFVIGNPYGLSGTISDGIISGIRKIDNNDLYQISAPISPGSSGGPVLNIAGEVIGVSVASLTSGQNLNFAIPSLYIKKLIKNESNTLTTLNIPKTNSKESTKPPKAGVFISDINWKTVGLQSPNYFDQYLHSLSISNLTENTICSIEIVAIVYKNNLPIDYFEFTMFRNSTYGNKDLGFGPINPFSGKTITLEDHTYWNIRCRTKLDFLFNKNKDEVVIFRLLDYTILDN